MILICVNELAGPTGYHKSVVETANALHRGGYPLAVLSILGGGDGSANAMPKWSLAPEIPAFVLQTLPAEGGRLLAQNVHPVLSGRVYAAPYAFTADQLAALRQLNGELTAEDTILFTTPVQALAFHHALSGQERRVRTVLQAHGDYRHHDQLWALVDEARDVIDRVQTVAEGLNDQFVPRFDPSDVVCIPNIHHPAKVVRKSSAGVEIVLPASFQHRKNQLDALRALAKIDDDSVHLSLWGNISPLNPYFIAVQETIDDLGLQDRVSIPGFGTEQDVYSGADIVLMTSLSEGFGYPLLEAAYHRLPTVTYDYEFGPRDVVEDGQSGYIVPVGDVDALAERLRALVADARLRERLGRRAREIFDERFSAEAVVAKYGALLGPPPGRDVDVAALFSPEGGEPVAASAISHRITRSGLRRTHEVTVRSDEVLHEVQVDDGERIARPRVRREGDRTVIEFPVGRRDVLSFASRPGATDRHYLAGPASGEDLPVLPRLRRDADYGDGTPPVEDTIFASRGGAKHISWHTTPAALAEFGAQSVDAVTWKLRQLLPSLPTRGGAGASTSTAAASTPTAEPAAEAAAEESASDAAAATPDAAAPADGTSASTGTSPVGTSPAETAPAEPRPSEPVPDPAASSAALGGLGGLGKAVGLPAQAMGSVGRVAKTYATTAASMLAKAVAVNPSAPTHREIPRHPWFPVTSGVDSFGAPINTPGGVEVTNSGTEKRPTTTIQGEYDWLLLRDGAAQRRIEAPWSYGEMFERLCAAEREHGLFDLTTADGTHVWELGRSALVIQLAEAAGLWGPLAAAQGTVKDVYTGSKRLTTAPTARTVVFDYVRRGQSGYRTAPFVNDESLFVVQPGADGYPDVDETNRVYPFAEFTQWKKDWRRKWSHLRVPEVDARPFEAALSEALGIHVDLGDHLRNRLAKFLAEREFFTPVFDRVQPEEVLIASSHWWAGIAAAAQRSGAQVSDIQYALTSHYAPSFWFGSTPHYGASRFYAWSDFWAARTNVYEEHVVVPRQQPELTAAIESPSTEEPRWDVCVISQPRVLRRILAFVQDLVRERPELRVVIAPHPAQREIIPQELAAAGLEDVVDTAEQDTLTTITKSVMAVGTFSTSLWESAALGVPTYVIEVPGFEETRQDVESGLFRLARSPQDLVPFEVPASRHTIFGNG
ncbi:glycosyltransferase family 4 protein [Brachybacterium aquaticum]|uniref:Glycosyltransferase involved in cell wall biosynthesis n=1 Tax=Brachybacterium aquaticum TaxID=1432564 RepID=A0A841ACK6_9MICO|nr:glycosyltransferase [Brachybacterium aquaticum]MBB5830904.1 glycosyltransferase involved in cell wall biosynthesis [Brachybacterium aquaticum]